MRVSYKVLCDSDISKELLLEELLSNEKVLKTIKSEFAKGYRNIEVVQSKSDGSNSNGNHESNGSNTVSTTLSIQSIKKIYSFIVNKDDYADLLTFAEEDAKEKKLLKKECQRVELVDIETI